MAKELLHTVIRERMLPEVGEEMTLLNRRMTMSIPRLSSDR